MATEDGDSSKTAEPQIADQAGDDTSTMPAEKLTTTQEFAPIMNIDTDGAPPPSTVASAAEADELLEKTMQASVASNDGRPVDHRVRRQRSASEMSLDQTSESSKLSHLTLLGGVGEEGHAPGVVYEYYKGDFTALPDFNTLEHSSCGTTKSIIIDSSTEITLFDPSLQKGRSTEVGNFAVRFTAQLKIPHAGTWTFYLSSNDGSALYVSGKKVIENDGLHYVVEKQGTLKIPSAGYYPITVCFFHKNGKLMEGVRMGASLGLSWYFPGTGWSPYPADRVAKAIIPESALLFSPREERVARLLDASQPTMAWESQEAAEVDNSEESRLQNLQEDMRDMSERLVSVQKALELERQVSQEMVGKLSKLSLFRSPSIEMLSENHHADEFADIHEKQRDFIKRHVADVKRLKTGYFFALGVQVKMRERQNNFSIQDAYERCCQEEVPVEDWPKFLRQVMEEART